MGEDIVIKENDPNNIELLAAQKQLYLRAKKIFLIQILFTSVIIVLLSILNLFYNFSKIISIYSLLISLIDLLLIKDSINNIKIQAAGIQEQFDTEVLSIPRNNIIEEVDSEIICRFSKQHRKIDKDYSKLKDWYSTSIKEINGPISKIICQRSNIVYDYTLRKNYNIFLSILIGFMCLVVLVLSIIKEDNLATFILTGLLPIFPILSLLIQVLKDNRSSNKTLEKLKKTADDIWNKVLIGHEINLLDNSRSLQNIIYQNRINSPLIFEWFYNLKRKQLEEEMYYSVERLVTNYKAKNKKED